MVLKMYLIWRIKSVAVFASACCRTQNKGTFLTCYFFSPNSSIQVQTDGLRFLSINWGDREELRTEACHHCPECTEILTALAGKMSKAGSENRFQIGQTPQLSMLEPQGRANWFLGGRQSKKWAEWPGPCSNIFEVLGDGLDPLSFIHLHRSMSHENMTPHAGSSIQDLQLHHVKPFLGMGGGGSLKNLKWWICLSVQILRIAL